MDEFKTCCTLCGTEIISEEDCFIYGDQILCEDCRDEHTVVCDCCGDRILRNESHCDDFICVCHDCYVDRYGRCNRCNCLVHDDNACYSDDDERYCEECYDKIFFSHYVIKK